MSTNASCGVHSADKERIREAAAHKVHCRTGSRTSPPTSGGSATGKEDLRIILQNVNITPDPENKFLSSLTGGVIPSRHLAQQKRATNIEQF